jgi:ATP-dependent Clp protease ATP-binding subunit ClpB
LEGVIGGEIPESVENSVLSELRGHFRPEFLNRVDETIIFKPLSLEEIEKIVTLLLADLNKTLAGRRISVVLERNAIEWIAEKGFDPVYGARPLKRFMQRSIQSSLARAIIEGRVDDGMTVKYSLDGDDLKLESATKGD